VSDSAVLVFGSRVSPEQFLELVAELGGEVKPDEWDAARLCRDGICVWIYTDPPGSFPDGEQFVAESSRLLGTRPFSVVTVEVPRAATAEWIAVDLVLAAAERWHFIVLDFAGGMLTLDEFSARVEHRSHMFFASEDSFRASGSSPVAARRAAAHGVTLVLPGDADPDGFVRLMRSLGASIKPDDETDVHLSRPGADVWVYLRPPDRARIAAGSESARAAVLGPPPYGAVTLEMSRTRGSALLAAEVVEAVAARWNVLISGPAGQSTTVDELRARVEAGADDLFPPEHR
jgi:hypothetical protein